MKNKISICLASIISIIALASCSNNQPVSDEFEVRFETGYSDVVIPSSKSTTVAQPSDVPGLHIEGYYLDPEFENEVDFSKKFTESATIYLKAIKGSGTSSDPYIIESSNSFNYLAHYGGLVSGNFRITKDFNITTKYSPNYEATIFNGTLDGQNHTITLDTYLDNISAVTYGLGDCGLIYTIGLDGSVSNLNIVGALNGSHKSIGTIANHNLGTIENIKTYGVSMHASNGYNSGVRLMTTYEEGDEVIIDDFGRVGMLEDLSKGGAGGIVGTNRGLIQNCINRMLVAATIGGGGISGLNYGTIENCFNLGAIGTTGNNAINSSYYNDPVYSFSYIGGISGANFGTIHQCGNSNQVFVARAPWKYNDAPVGYSDYINRIRVGGIVGYNEGTYDEATSSYTGGIITECFNFGRVHGDMQVGGIAGYSSGYVASCQAICPVGGRFCVGGIVGWMSGDNPNDRISVVTHCYSTNRMVTGSAGSYLDINGNSVTGVALIQLSSTVSTTNVEEYYNVAKYATNCIYHNYSGTSKPLNPATGELDTASTSTTATFDDSSKRAVIAGSGAWAEYINPDEATAIVGFNSSWQAHLNVVLSWMNKTITFVNGSTSTTIRGVVGIDYVNRVVAKSSYYAGPLSSNYSCAKADKLPTLGANQVWVTEQGNIDSIWDGYLTDNITVYAMNK